MFSILSLFAVICVFSVIGRPDKKLNFKGCLITEALTPFTESGKFNPLMIKPLAAYYAKNNITQLLLMHFDAEVQTLRLKERKELVKCWMEEACKYNFIISVEIGLQKFVNALELAKYINDLTCTCNKKVEAMTYTPEQIYKAQTKEELMYEINMITKVAPNIPILFNDLISTAPIIRTDEIVLASCAMEKPILSGMDTTIVTYLDIFAVDPKCKLEVFIYDIQYMYAACLLGLRSVTLGPNLSPRITREIEAAALACDRVKAKKLQEEMNSWITAITNSQKDPINTYKRPYFTNIKAAFQMITGMDLGARPPFEKTNSTEYEEIRGRLEELGVPLAESA